MLTILTVALFAAQIVSGVVLSRHGDQDQSSIVPTTTRVKLVYITEYTTVYTRPTTTQHLS